MSSASIRDISWYHRYASWAAGADKGNDFTRAPCVEWWSDYVLSKNEASGDWLGIGDIFCMMEEVLDERAG